MPTLNFTGFIWLDAATDDGDAAAASTTANPTNEKEEERFVCLYVGWLVANH